MLNLESVKLTSHDKKRAEEALKNWNELSKVISEQDLDGIRVLLAHEVNTRMRLTVVQRLVARFGVLEQHANEREVMGLLAKRLGK
jgi:hypothetical protein